MLVEKSLYNLVSSRTSNLKYEEDDECPLCKSKISPVYLFSTLNSIGMASVYNYCRGCCSTFITTYLIREDYKTGNATYYNVSKKISSEPNRFVEHDFEKEIKELSPQFVKIYNQALAAESMALDEIAGLGYRKSLEFLIKDFAIKEFPNDEDSIKSMNLSPCIKKYIDDSRIKTLAEKSAWIGNDEAHYVRKQEDRDISDMKSFIKAAVYFISMILITQDAESMIPK